MKSTKWTRRADTPRVARRFSPRFVELEVRDVPATFYVDPATAGSLPGTTVTYNAGKPGEHTGTAGVDVFGSFGEAYALTTANGTADTINVSYGTVDVDNAGGTLVVSAADGPLSIVGSGAGATTLRPTTDTTAEFGPDAAVFRADGAGAQLNVSELTFDGQSPFLKVGQAFRYQNGATGTISKIQSQYVIFTPNGDNSGAVVTALDAGTNITVSGSSFADYGALGVGLNNGASATISGNTFYGGGAGDYVVYGVQVGGGSTATISGNTFFGHQGAVDPAVDVSAGILVSGDDGSGTDTFVPSKATIVGNKIFNNTVGIVVGTPDSANAVVDASNAVVQFNNITGNDTAILTDTTTTVNALFNWWGDVTGPFAAGNVTAAGNNPGGKGNPVDESVLWKDATIIPAGGVLQGPVTIGTATSGDNFRDQEAKATVTVTGPTNPLSNVNALVYTVQFSEPVFDFTAADIVVTNGKVTGLVADPNGTTYTVTVDQTKAGDVSVSVPAATIGPDNLFTIRTALFAGTQASNVATTTVIFSRGFGAGGGQGNPQPFFGIDQNFATRTGIVPFEATYTGGVRIATADLTGDGTLDVIVAAGANHTGEIKIYNGLTTALIADFNPFEASFTKGAFVAAGDVTGDGVPDIVVTSDVGGSSRTRVLDGAVIVAAGKGYNGSTGVVADFFAIQDPNFFGGARAGVGDINNDGFADLAISAGFGGGPRIAGYSGKGISSASQVKLFADFFAFSGTDPNTLQDGAYVAVGDLNGDGFADVATGAGEGGGPRVQIYSGKAIGTTLANFFAGTVDGGIGNRGGVRVAMKDIDGDGKFDVVTAPGGGGGAAIGVFFGSTLAANGGIVPADRNIDLFGDSTNGAYVG